MKKKLSIEDHRQLAHHLRNIAGEISAIREVISGYGLVSTAGRRVFSLENQLRELKCALDSLMFRDHAADAGANADVYYGPADSGDRR